MAQAVEVARYVIRFFQEAGDPVSNLKLQKLLYYIQGWHLAIKKRPLFQSDFEAWVHGPVLPSIYGQYKHYRWNPITEDVAQPDFAPEEKAVIDEVLSVYGGDTGFALEQRSHTEAPWVDARAGIAQTQESRAVISKDGMQRFFESLMQ